MHVAVVGAGPAGAWAAYSLARAGARVTIFDPSHPREKPCGGGVTGRALAIVGGAIDPGALPSVAVRRARFTEAAGRGDAVVDLDANALVVASRSAFDAALLAAACRAGAQHRASRVVDIDATATGIEIRARTAGVVSAFRRTSNIERHSADFIVGADGPNSLVRRRMAAPFRRDQLSVATGFFARGATSGEIVIEMTTAPAGYIWSFPRPDHLAIGVCAQANEVPSAPALRARSIEWIRRTRVGGGAPLEPYSWPIPSLGARDLAMQPIAGAGWCLVGDAAGLVDPITREGIYFALASGGWAAAALATGRDLRADYAARVRDEAVAELARAARVKDLFFRPAFAALLVRALRESAAIRSVMADLIAGTQSYRSLKARLLGTFEFGLAWRALRSAL